jgi:hypothetical protein
MAEFTSVLRLHPCMLSVFESCCTVISSWRIVPAICGLMYSWSRKMLLKERSLVAFSRNLALLFLAFAVFSWGLQAKLELYKAPAAQRLELAKLSTEKHSAKVLSALTQRDMKQSPSPIPTVALIFCFLLVVPVLQSVAQRATIGLSSPGKFYLHGVSSLNRPPPALLELLLGGSF